MCDSLFLYIENSNVSAMKKISSHGFMCENVIEWIITSKESMNYFQYFLKVLFALINNTDIVLPIMVNGIQWHSFLYSIIRIWLL